MMTRLDHTFAVFNGHINNAAKRANAEFVAQFGQEVFEAEIAPLDSQGIMSIFDRSPTIYTMAWVVLVTAFVNEKQKRSKPRRRLNAETA